MTNQLSLFDREERSAIQQYDAGMPSIEADVKNNCFDWRGAENYLQRMIAEHIPMIHLHLCGSKKNICHCLSLTQYEPMLAGQSYMRKDLAINRLAAAGYVLKCRLNNGVEKIDTWHRPWDANDKKERGIK